MAGKAGPGKTGSSRKSTIYDIATATQTSPATVSMVLNGTWQRYRISEDTALRVAEAARALGYAVNMKARALRLSRSGLAGMVIPHYRNRFFADLAEEFESRARTRGLCPMVVSGLRDPVTERSVTETLLSHQVEFLFFAGVAHPEPLNTLCSAAGVPSVNVDLPGEAAPSVVTDNRAGAYRLTRHLAEQAAARAGSAARIDFLGGVPDEFATDGRAAGFRDALIERDGAPPPEDRIRRCGYWPEESQAAVAALHAELGRLPDGLFVNSLSAFEGVVQYFRSLDDEPWHDCAIGCFDWDPFAAFLPFPVAMVRQDVATMIDVAFARIAGGETTGTTLIPPLFVPNDGRVMRGAGSERRPQTTIRQPAPAG